MKAIVAGANAWRAEFHALFFFCSHLSDSMARTMSPACCMAAACISHMADYNSHMAAAANLPSTMAMQYDCKLDGSKIRPSKALYKAF